MGPRGDGVARRGVEAWYEGSASESFHPPPALVESAVLLQPPQGPLELAGPCSQLAVLFLCWPRP